MKTAPIVLFVYNRLEHTKQTLQALKANALAVDSDLFIYSDGPRSEAEITNIQEVRKYIKSVKGFNSVTVVERNKNYGLANSIIDGVTNICNRYGKVIVLEDDIVTSPYFLDYMNNALEVYKDEAQVASIHGYTYPTTNTLPESFFIRGADCWGWATWQRAWEFFETDGKKLLKSLQDQNLIDRFDFNHTYPFSRMLEDQIKGKNNSWAIRWHATCFIKNFLTLYPGQSLIQNIGFDNSGTHCSNTDIYNQTVSIKPIKLQKLKIVENEFARKEFESFFREKNKITLRRRLKSLAFKIKRYFC